MMSKVNDDELPDLSFKSRVEKKLSMVPYVSRILLPDIVPDTMLLTEQARFEWRGRQRERAKKKEKYKRWMLRLTGQTVAGKQGEISRHRTTTLRHSARSEALQC